MAEHCRHSMAHFTLTPEEQLRSGKGLYESLGIDRPAPHKPLVDYHTSVPVYCFQSVALRHCPWCGAELPRPVLPEPISD